MRRPVQVSEWAFWVPVVIWGVLGLVTAYQGPAKPEEMDMPEILAAIDARGGLRSCFGWFLDDWPLGNRLYRPVSACSFAVDRTLFGDWATGYRLVSRLMLVLTAVLLALLVRGMGGGRLAGAAAGALFLSVQWYYLMPESLLCIAAVGVAGWLLARGWGGDGRGRGPRAGIEVWVVVGVTLFASVWDRYAMDLPARWIAARTVVLCTLFVVAAMLCVTRYMQTASRWWAYAVIALSALAVGAYEEGIVVPPLVAALVWAQRGGVPGRRSWLLVVACIAVVAGYWLVRRHVLGPVPGVYEVVVIRPNRIRLWFWLQYAFPPFAQVQGWQGIEPDLWSLCTLRPWLLVLQALGLVAALVTLKRCWRLALPFWWWRAVSFFPMAMLRPMDHYYLLSEAGSCALGGVLLGCAVARARRPKGGEAPEPGSG